MASLKYLGEALFLLSTVASIVRWIGRTYTETIIPPSHAELSPEIELPDMLPALVQSGAAPAAELGRMSSAERVALYRATFESEAAESRRVRPGAGWSEACAGCGFPLGAGTIPIGYVTHCPHCGKARTAGRGSGVGA